MNCYASAICNNELFVYKSMLISWS